MVNSIVVTITHTFADCNIILLYWRVWCMASQQSSIKLFSVGDLNCQSDPARCHGNTRLRQHTGARCSHTSLWSYYPQRCYPTVKHKPNKCDPTGTRKDRKWRTGSRCYFGKMNCGMPKSESDSVCGRLRALKQTPNCVLFILMLRMM